MKYHVVQSTDGVQLHVQSVGQGVPIVFVHEFAGDHRSWEPPLAEFSKDHQCVVYNARGYPPSSVPDQPFYGQAKAVEDLLAVLDGLKLERAHIVGLSMGGFGTLHFGLRHPRALSLTICGAGCGSDASREQFQRESLGLADRFERLGCPEVAKTYAATPPRLTFQHKLLEAGRARPARACVHRSWCAGKAPVHLRAQGRHEQAASTHLDRHWRRRPAVHPAIAVHVLKHRAVWALGRTANRPHH